MKLKKGPSAVNQKSRNKTADNKPDTSQHHYLVINYKVINTPLANTSINESASCQITEKVSSLLSVTSQPVGPQDEMAFCPVKYSTIGVMPMGK